MNSKKCPRCETTYYTISKHFYKSRDKKDGFSSICKKCKREERKYYYQIHKSKKEVFEKVCEYSECKKPFKTTNSVKRFCCEKCSWRASHFKIDKESYNFKRNFKIKYERSKEVAPQNHKHWSEKDVMYLVKKREDGVPYKDIALTLGRKIAACTKKYNAITKSKIL